MPDNNNIPIPPGSTPILNSRAVFNESTNRMPTPQPTTKPVPTTPTPNSNPTTPSNDSSNNE